MLLCIQCNLYSIMSFSGDLGAVCATLLEAIPSIEYVSCIIICLLPNFHTVSECCYISIDFWRRNSPAVDLNNECAKFAVMTYKHHLQTGRPDLQDMSDIYAGISQSTRHDTK